MRLELTGKNRKERKLETEITFSFEDHEDFPELNIDASIKTPVQSRNIKIIKHKKRDSDPSTKLF